MNNFNFDENTINKLKNMINNGDLNNVISQIPPEMMQNISSAINNNNNSNSNNNDTSNSYASNFSNANSSNNSNNNFNNIDMNTILKMKSVIDGMNSSNDPRSNLLNSLKPYLRDSRKEKVDQYANLLNFAKIAELLKNDNKEHPNA